MTKILVLEKPEEKLRRERERLLGELSVYGERLAFLQDTVDEIKEMIEYYDGAIKSLERLREKEIEHREAQLLSKDETIDNAFDFIRKHENKERVSLLKNLLNKGFEYVARDKGGVLCAYDGLPLKADELGYWDIYIDFDYENIRNDNFPEVKWTDDEPTKISNLLESYENGGENGKVED